MESIKELREICQKSVGKEDSITTKYLARPFSIYITKICLLFGINVLSVTILHTLLVILAAALFMFADYWYNLIAVILLQAAYVFDCVDGELARYYKTASINGKYLDCVSHYIAHPLVIFGLGLGVYKYFNNYLLLVAAFVAGIFFLLIDVVRISRFEVLFDVVRKSEKIGKVLKKDKDVATLKQYNTLPKKLFYLFNTLFNFRGLSYILLISAVFNLVYVYLFLILIYAIILPLVTIARICYEYRKGLERFLPYLKTK